MRAGLMKEIICIESPTAVRDQYGGSTQTWTSFAHGVRAEVKSAVETRVTENMEIRYAEVVSFRCRFIEGLTANMRICWHGEYYRIIGREFTRNYREVVIRTELIND